MMIKAVHYKHGFAELSELSNTKYCIRWRSQNETYTSVDIIDLKLALEMFDDVLVIVEGN